ncbi:MAG: FecR family protein [Elusimicrobia bacterium]|nr:FecR family protein [Elusimicrobiota bacterium]
MAFIVWAFLGLASAVQAAPTVSALSGSVFILKSGTKVWQGAGEGHVLYAGDQVRTASGSSATIGFDDGSRINLEANGSFILQEATSGGTSLKLAIGVLRAWVDKALSRRFEVRTPTAVCSVRGTEFSVDVNVQGHTSIQMFSGMLAVADQHGNETVIRDQQSLRVTDQGFTAGQTSQGQSGRDALKEQARREVGLEMSKEAVQSAAAFESMNAVYKEGKAIIDVGGNRVRIEEYIVRPAADQFKLVVLNEREQRFDYFYYKGTFNTTLPDDLSIALRQLPGCIGAPCGYYLKDYETGRSNTQDSMLEVTSGGHQVDVNHDGNPDDAVSAAFDPVTNSFVALAPGTNFYQTLYDYNKLTFNGVPHGGWVPANPADAIVNGGPGIANYGSKINSGSVLRDWSDPTSSYSPASLTTVRRSPACDPPDCTYDEAGVEHSVVYASNGDGSVWEKYDSYVISDEGRVANTGDFAGSYSGTDYKQTLLHWNFETIVTASEFSGRKIDLAVEPKIFIQSGLIQ